MANGGGRSGPPPTSGGERVAILPHMEFIAIRLAKRQIGTQVRSTRVNVLMIYQQNFL